jgi:hypothetical protein
MKKWIIIILLIAIFMDFGAAVSQRGYDVKNCADRHLVYSSAFQTLKVFAAYSISVIVPTYIVKTYTVDPASDIFTSNNHGLQNGDGITFSTGDTFPDPISVNPPNGFYFVVNSTQNTFQISTSYNGAVLDITTSGSGTQKLYGTDRFVAINHNLGFLAPYIVEYNGNSRNGVANSYFFSDSQGGATYDQNYSNQLLLDINSGWDGANAPGGNSQAGDTCYFTVYVLLNDFSAIFHKEINTYDPAGSLSNDYGFRISKDGFDVKTCADKDCVLSSSFFNRIIDQQGYFTSPSGGTPQLIPVTDQGFIPSVLSYYQYSGNIYISFLASYVESNQLSLGMSAGDTLYYIIFKDKLN